MCQAVSTAQSCDHLLQQRVQFVRGISLHIQLQLIGNAPAIVIKPPGQIEIYIHQQHHKHSIAQYGLKISPAGLPAYRSSDKHSQSIQQPGSRQPIKDIPHAERQPSKQQPLHTGYHGVNAGGIIFLDGTGEKGKELDAGSKYYKDYPGWF